MVSFTTLDHGANSAIETPMTQYYSTESDFQSFWKDHTSNTSPPPPIPSVDFEHDAVICVFRGTKSTGGYGVEITSVKEEANDDDDNKNKIVIHYETSDPPPGGITISVLTQPYHIIQVPKVISKEQQVLFVQKQAVQAVRWMVNFESKRSEDRDAVVKIIESHETVNEVKFLKGVGILFVSLKPGMYENEDAEKTFLESIDGVKFAEADRPMAKAGGMGTIEL